MKFCVFATTYAVSMVYLTLNIASSYDCGLAGGIEQSSYKLIERQQV